MTRHDEPSATPGATKRQRIAKLMARAGLCSRRDAEAWIVDGRVSVNGTVLTSPAMDVDDDDRILVDGEPLPIVEKTRLFLFHKPRGLVTSDHDPEGRATVADYLRDHWPEGPRVVTIGRLDINTEGLLLLTNDGGLARLLELPRTGWVRRYRVRAKGEANPADLEALAHGVTIDGIDYAGIEAKLDRVQGANCWLTMGLREGKNREVKRVLEHIGLEVNRLIRLSFGPFQLLELPEGAVEEVRTRVLRDQLGENLAVQAGVDFGESEPVKAPREERPSREPRREKAATERPARSASRGDRPAPSSRPVRASSERGQRPRPDHRDGHDEMPPPQRERPAAGTRRHVSALRAAEGEDARKGPRKRIERTDTQDRRERTVKVERLVAARPAPERPQVRRRPGSDPGLQDPNKRFVRGDAGPRNARSDDRRGDTRRPDARDTKRDFAAGPKRRPASDRDARPGRDEARPTRRDDRSDARRDGPPTPRRHASPSALGKIERMSRSGPAPEARPDGYKKARSFSANKEERRAGADRGERRRPDGDRPARAPRPEGERPVRATRPYGDRPVRTSRPDGDRKAASPRSERPPTRRPSGERSERPGGDQRETRRPGADRPARSRPGTDERREPRRDDKAPRPAGRGPGARPAGGRASGAASRKPNSRKPGPTGAGAGHRGGKPPRGPSKPKG